MATIIEVLLVEDNPADVDLMKETLEDDKIRLHLNVVTDGEEAMNYLQKKGSYKNAVTPDLIFLDLNLPKMDGREVLAAIKNDSELKTIPVVILSTSDAETDVFKSYAIGANCYVTKPVGLEQFTKIIKEIQEFWFGVVKLPPREP